MNHLNTDIKKTLYPMGILLGVILGLYLFFQYLFSYIAPFLVGWLLSLLFHPFVTLLQKKYHIPRWIGSLLSILLLLIFFVVVVVGAWNNLYGQAVHLWNHMPQYLSLLEHSWNQFLEKWATIVSALPHGIHQLIPKGENTLPSFLSKIVQSGSSHSFSALISISNGFMITVVALISSYFFTKDKEEIAAFVKGYLPKQYSKEYILIKKELKYSFWAYIKTQCILMIYTFSICLIGLIVFRSPYAFLLSVIISLIDAIPFFGSGFILWPGAVICLISGENVLALGYGIIYLCVNLMRQVMQPKILGTQIGLHPLLTLISMYIGLKTLGILGMILGPILAVLFKALYHAKGLAQTKEPSLPKDTD
jgi:sporulation integral membrane protein YtvI